MTGITWVSRESIFSDLNNLNVVTTTSDEYADYNDFIKALLAGDEKASNSVPLVRKEKKKNGEDG